jgi:hypothetical protein
MSRFFAGADGVRPKTVEALKEYGHEVQTVPVAGKNLSAQKSIFSQGFGSEESVLRRVPVLKVAAAYDVIQKARRLAKHQKDVTEDPVQGLRDKGQGLASGRSETKTEVEQRRSATVNRARTGRKSKSALMPKGRSYVWLG